MTVADVMTHGAVSATAATTYRDLVDLVETRAVNAVPIIDRLMEETGVRRLPVVNRVTWLVDDTINVVPAAGL